MKPYVGRALAAVVLAVTGLVIAVAPAGANSSTPTLSLLPAGPMFRGQWAKLNSAGLQAGTNYTVTSDHGTFSDGAHTATFTPPDSNPVSLAFELPASDPITSFAADLTATGEPTVLASLNIAVAAPTMMALPHGHACPGIPTTIVGKGFIDTAYLLHTDSGTTISTPMFPGSGAFTVPLTLDDTATSEFTLTATPMRGSATTVSATLPVSVATMSVRQPTDPWTVRLVGSCFAPGEQVALSSSGSVSLPATATANSNGAIIVTAPDSPDAQTNNPIVLTATGQTSRQRAVLSTTDVVRAALWPRQVLAVSSVLQALASSTPGYQLEVTNCVGGIYRSVPSGSEVSWSALPLYGSATGPCSLTMQADGNAVLSDSSGKPLWSSGTHVAGSRLVLGDDAALRVLSPTGITLFNSSIAPSSVSVASSRVHSAVYINGLVHQRAPTAQLERGVGRTVYLQRYLAGRWQNVLSRVTDSQGQLAVGFIQNTVYQYRLVLIATSTATSATSASTFR